MDGKTGGQENKQGRTTEDIVTLGGLCSKRSEEPLQKKMQTSLGCTDHGLTTRGVYASMDDG